MIQLQALHEYEMLKPNPRTGETLACRVIISVAHILDPMGYKGRTLRTVDKANSILASAKVIIITIIASESVLKILFPRPMAWPLHKRYTNREAERREYDAEWLVILLGRTLTSLLTSPR